MQTSSYLKSPYYSPLGFPDGMYRVGPLARLNVAEQMGTPKADAELKKFKKLGRGRSAVTSSFLYHYARLIEILASIERVEAALDDADLLSEDLRADAGINSLRGVGVSEAPRGTLFHDYTVDRDGLLQKVNLIVATGQNNLAMNQTVAQIARHYVRGNKIPEPMLNRVEHGIRCYDPCLSCSTHAVGQMPLHVQLIAPGRRRAGRNRARLSRRFSRLEQRRREAGKKTCPFAFQPLRPGMLRDLPAFAVSEIWQMLKLCPILHA